MNLEKFTQKSLEALQLAQSLAAEHNNTQIEECHLLYAVIAQDGGIGAEIFRKMGVDVNQLAFDVKQGSFFSPWRYWFRCRTRKNIYFS